MSSNVPILPYNVRIEDLENVLQFLRKRPTGASEAALRRALPKKLLDPRKTGFYLMTGLVSVQDDQWRLTSAGAEYVHGDAESRKRILRDVLRGFPPYQEILEWALHEQKNRITAEELRHKWVTDFSDVVSTDNEYRVEGAPLTMFNLCQHAELGEFILGRRGAPSRLELDLAELQEHVEARSRDPRRGSFGDIAVEDMSGERPKVRPRIEPLHDAPEYDQEIPFPLSNHMIISVRLPAAIPPEDEKDIKTWFDLLLRRRMRQNDCRE